MRNTKEQLTKIAIIAVAVVIGLSMAMCSSGGAGNSSGELYSKLIDRYLDKR